MLISVEEKRPEKNVVVVLKSFSLLTAQKEVVISRDSEIEFKKLELSNCSL